MSPDREYRWMAAFQALAVERCRDALREAGVPRPMAASPDQLQSIAQQYLVVHGWSRVLIPRPGQYREAFPRLVKYAFSQLQEAYGEEAADDLYKWMERFFIDDMNSRWRVLAFVLRQLAGLHFPAAVPSPLSAESQKRLVATVRKNFDPYSKGEEEERRGRARGARRAE